MEYVLKEGLKMKCILRVVGGIILCIFLISCSNDQELLKRFLNDAVKDQRRIVFVQLYEIKLWKPQNETLSIIKSKDTPIKDSFISPSFCFNREKVLFSMDETNNDGKTLSKLVLFNLKNKSEEIIYKSNKRIISPILSPDNKKIAFLSDYKWENAYSLFILNVSTKKIIKLLDNNTIYGGGYNFNISWSSGSNEIIYSSIDGFINLINISTKESRKLIKGYNPLFSPDGKQILFSDSQYKPYTPLIYDLVSGQTQKLKAGSDVYNAIWSPDEKYLIVVKSHTSLKDMLSFNEWGNKVVVYDIATQKKTDLFKFEGFEYIDFK